MVGKSADLKLLAFLKKVQVSKLSKVTFRQRYVFGDLLKRQLLFFVKMCEVFQPWTAVGVE